MTRYVVIGAGAVGGTIAGRLAKEGNDVVAVARGPHLAALRANGLRLRTPDFDVRVHISVVAGPDELTLHHDDVLILTTKTHQAETALAQWSSAPVEAGATSTAGRTLPILTAQNGVASEVMALRYFDRVYGVCVWAPTVHLQPGEVIARGTPDSATLHISRFPADRAHGTDQDFLQRLAAVFAAAGLQIRLPDDVMPWKYRKLISNIGNAFQALIGPDGSSDGLASAARKEARAVLAAAGIEVTADEVEAAARSRSFRVAEVPGAPERLGGSSWQSLVRGTGSIETDYLNGEVALIARRHGLAAPVNAGVAARARQAAQDGMRPGDISASELAAYLGLPPPSSD